MGSTVAPVDARVFRARGVMRSTGTLIMEDWGSCGDLLQVRVTFMAEYLILVREVS